MSLFWHPESCTPQRADPWAVPTWETAQGSVPSLALVYLLGLGRNAPFHPNFTGLSGNPGPCSALQPVTVPRSSGEASWQRLLNKY